MYKDTFDHSCVDTPKSLPVLGRTVLVRVGESLINCRRYERGKRDVLLRSFVCIFCNRDIK